VEKAAREATPLLKLAGSVADPSPVVSKAALIPGERMFGDLMVAWLGPNADSPRIVNHLPDGSFFMELLRRAYAPVIQRRPDLAIALNGYSRLEMSLTNDTLQIQLAEIPGYSMVRHHALMLFYATLWLDEPHRTMWLDLYDELVTYVLQGPRRAPSVEEIAEIEARNGADMRALTGKSLDPASAQDLLDSPDALRRIYDNQLCAGAAIGLLWREFRSLAEGERDDWHRLQLGRGYIDSTYLQESWARAGARTSPRTADNRKA
jgi:hypothetical protein